MFQDGRDRGSKAHRPRLIDGHIASGGMHLGMYESSLCGPCSDRRDLAGTPLASRHSGGPASTPLLDFCWPDDFRVLSRSCMHACMTSSIAASEEPAIATTMRIAKSREREREGTHDNYYMYRLYVVATSTLDSHSANSCTACSITVYLGNPPVPVLFRVFKFAAL